MHEMKMMSVTDKRNKRNEMILKKYIRRNWTLSKEMVGILEGCNNSIRNTSLYVGFFLHFSNWMNDADDERSSILKRNGIRKGKCIHENVFNHHHMSKLEWIKKGRENLY